MTISVGSRLGPYEVLAPIGAGGMGEVFKARDTRLDRSVAIKVLPAEFAENAQLKLRFEREAKTISQLNHPNICTVFDVGVAQTLMSVPGEALAGVPVPQIPYIVMELLDGVSLADRIARGPLPASEVLRTGAQIADALDAAHKAGVVHRDLKPGNIMLTKSGAKLLDFGLAKSVSSRAPESARDPLGDDPGDSSPSSRLGMTVQKPLTREGTVLGTFQYMAPEQLEGLEADARTDIFGLGAVLYEMATGKRAFEATSKTSLIAKIVSSDPPPVSAVTPLSPPALDHVIQKCLAKGPEERWQSAHDIAEELRWISESGSQAGVAAPVARRRRSRERMAWAAAVILAAVVAAVAAMRMPHSEPVITSSITAPLHAPFDIFGQAVLSPDGSAIAFAAASKEGSSIWIRPLDRGEPRKLQSTEGGWLPFWSPDGKSLGFFADDKLKRIAVAGGPAQVICATTGPSPGGTWNGNGVILFSSANVGPIMRVAATGGKPEPLTRLQPTEEAHRWPFFLPDGEHFIFLGDAPRTENHHLKIGSLRDGTSRDLTQAVSNAIYVDPGQLMFVRGGALLAQAFDIKALALRGEPRVLAEQLVESGLNHHFEFSASPNGRLIYRSASPDSQLIWLDRAGKTLATIGPARRIAGFSLARDQQHIAVGGLDADGRSDDVWVVDERGMTTRLTFDPESDGTPVWSPDGKRITFFSMRDGLGDVYMTDIANPANVQRLTKSIAGMEPLAWSPDGKVILIIQDKTSDRDIMMYSVDSHELRPYLVTPFLESAAQFSPDGTSVAFVSNQSGRDEVYVERFPTHAERRQVSFGGGEQPAWSADGKDLFYSSSDSTLMSVDMRTQKATPMALFHLPGFSYAVARDGRFLVDRRVDDPFKVPLTLVSNFSAAK